MYHLQVISSITNIKNAHSKHINIELDDDYQSIQEIEEQITQKFNKKLSDLQTISKNEYIYTTDTNERIYDYVIRIEEKNAN